MLVVASFIAAGEARSWDRADAFAEESRQPIHRAGMLLGAVGLAALVAVSPMVVAPLHGTRGFGLGASAWLAFAFGATLFTMVMGLTTIALPALGELAARGEVSPQLVVDEFVRQPAIVVAFLGGNVVYLAWLVLGAALARSGIFAPWLGWAVMAGAIAGWLRFLHVPIFQQFGAPMWPASIVLLGAHLMRLRSRVDRL